jgi:uncharacterized OB-fold protein
MSAQARSPEFDGFFEHAQHGRLAFPWCKACGRMHWYPMPICPHCQAGDISWQAVAGRGEIFSFTQVHHAFDKSRREQLPYVVALVVFEDAPGVQFITNIVDSMFCDIAIGRAVEPVFATSVADQPTVLFRLVDSSRGAST